MNRFSITTSRTNSPEHSQDERLNRVIHMIIAASSAADYFEDAPQILHLHDHKGALEVYWAEAPEKQHKECIEMIWEMMNELAMNVQHAYPGISDAEIFQLRCYDEVYNLATS